MPRGRPFFVLLFALALAVGSVGAQRSTDSGPGVGTVGPDFSLPSHDGRTHTLGSLAGPDGIVLIFLHSIPACPYCRSQLVEIERGRELLRAEGFGLAAFADSETRLEAAGVPDISGELDHQACDDAVCFPPQTVPLRWSVKTTGLER